MIICPGETFEVWECISNFIPHFIQYVITYPCGAGIPKPIHILTLTSVRICHRRSANHIWSIRYIVANRYGGLHIPQNRHNDVDNLDGVINKGYSDTRYSKCINSHNMAMAMGACLWDITEYWVDMMPTLSSLQQSWHHNNYRYSVILRVT